MADKAVRRGEVRCEGRARRGSGRRVVLAMSLGLFTAYAGEGAAQATWTITGRVIDSESGAGLRNALVMIEGYGTALSSTGGA